MLSSVALGRCAPLHVQERIAKKSPAFFMLCFLSNIPARVRCAPEAMTSQRGGL